MKSHRNNEIHSTVPVGISKVAGDELLKAVITHTFISAPERLETVVPEEERSVFQNLLSLSSDLLVNLGAREISTGNCTIPEGLAVCTTASIAKALALRAENQEDKKLELPNINDAKAIGKATVQAGIIRMFRAHAEKVGESILIKTGATTASATATAAIVGAPVAGLFITPLRLPGVRQVPENEKTVAQKAGHMVVNAGIIASLGLLPISIPVALAGCFIGVIGNTIVGKQRSCMKPLIQETGFGCSPSA